MPKNMALTPRATSSYYNDLYPDSGACLDGFEQAMSRDSDLDQEEEDGCEGPEERRDMHHMYESDVKEHGPNETLAYDNRETETRPLSYNECQIALATLPPNEVDHVEAEEMEELRHYTESKRSMQDGPWDPEMLAKGPTQVPGRSPGTTVGEPTAERQQTHPSSSHKQTKSTVTSSDTSSEAVFSASSHTGSSTLFSSTIYVCSHCGKHFDRPADGRKHERYHLPSDKRPYPCDECEMSFVDSHKLGRHKKSHSEERTFACDLCSKCYKRKDILQRHKKVTHKHVLAASAGAQVPAEPQHGAAAASAQRTNRADVPAEISTDIPGAISTSNGLSDDELDADFFPDFISRANVRNWLGSGFQ